MFGPQLLIPPTLKTYKVISISCVIISAAAFFLVSSSQRAPCSFMLSLAKRVEIPHKTLYGLVHLF